MSGAVNTCDALRVVPTGAALGAEIRGVDLSRPIGDDLRSALQQAWYDHLVLLFRNQNLDPDIISGIGDLFGGSQETGGQRRIRASGHEIPKTKTTRSRSVSVISNLDVNGNPVPDNDSLGSYEVDWHTDNSFVEVPPAGTFLYAVEVPTNGGGDTSFNNQYLAWENLPAELKKTISNLHQVHDWSRNSAGKLRQAAALPKTREEVEGAIHPLVRIHPYSRRPALYLGRRRPWPSNYIVEMPNTEGDELLEQLWAHATQDTFKWTHVWEAGDAVLWDNRCVMHYRTEIDSSQRRVMWRTLVRGEQMVPLSDHAQLV